MSAGLEAEPVARLCVEQWKLVRAAERAAALMPKRDGQRLAAQVRYAERQLATLMDRLGLRLVQFEGLAMEPGLAASADNAEDFAPDEALVVTATVEPAVLRDMRVISPGRVLVGPAGPSNQDGQDASRD